MLSGRRIVLTGVTGQIGSALARRLAAANEVFGVARFADPDARRRVERLGVQPVACDIADGDLRAIPDRVDVVVHLAAHQGPEQDDDRAIRVNAEATGLLLQRCRSAAATLVMSSHSVYRPHDDPAHAYRESDPLGGAETPWAPSYATSKIAQEAVARTCARTQRMPVTIARMNAAYGDAGGLPLLHLDAIVRGDPVVTRWDPCRYSPVHEDDIAGQLEPLLGAAAVPATVVNWAGDEVVTVQEWCHHLGELTGRDAQVEVVEVPGAQRGAVADVTRRRAITGPCTVDWRTGLARAVAARAALHLE